MNEQPITITCENETLFGILSIPQEVFFSDVALLISVGGPQYRVGSHRQFVTLARALAERGCYVMRFDYRGMGDSTGPSITFEDAQSDIRSAVDALVETIPQIKRVVLWGLCDAASSNLMYSINDNRIKGLAVLNPWVRTEVGQAQAQLHHYYMNRIIQKEFWRKLISKEVDVITSLKEISVRITTIIKNQIQRILKPDSGPNTTLPKKLEHAFLKYSGPILAITSGDDLVAKEFVSCVRQSEDWCDVMSSEKVDWIEMDSADHTFSRQIWKDAVIDHTFQWLEKRFAANGQDSSASGVISD